MRRHNSNTTASYCRARVLDCPQITTNPIKPPIAKYLQNRRAGACSRRFKCYPYAKASHFGRDALSKQPSERLPLWGSWRRRRLRGYSQSGEQSMIATGVEDWHALARRRGCLIIFYAQTSRNNQQSHNRNKHVAVLQKHLQPKATNCPRNTQNHKT